MGIIREIRVISVIRVIREFWVMRVMRVIREIKVMGVVCTGDKAALADLCSIMNSARLNTSCESTCIYFCACPGRRC